MDVHLMSAFTDAGRGGNPAGVVLEADALNAAQKLALAAAVGLSETAFVSRSSTAAFKLEFFTPTRQIPHCGHATIATFCLLRRLGRIGDGPTSKETIDGKRDIVIEGPMAYMEQRAPRYADLTSFGIGVDEVLRSLGAASAPGLAPRVVDTGNAFLVVPLRDRDATAALTPDFAAIERVSERLDLVGYYAFSPQTDVAGRDAGARMFAPRYGIREESATGMAAGALACFLHDVCRVDKDVFSIEQGRLMQPPSPSVIAVRLARREGKIERLLAGGTATPIRTVQIVV